MIYYISSNDYLLSCIYLLHDVLFNYLPCCHGAGSWCKKCCTAHAFFPRKMEIHSQAVPLWLFDRGFSRKKHPNQVFFGQSFLREVAFLKSSPMCSEAVESKTPPLDPDSGSSLQILIPSAACLGEEQIKIAC